MKIVENVKTLIRGSINIDKLKKNGLKIGDNFNAMEGVIIDPGHCWLIEIGNNVTLAPRVHILAHDASMKKILGYAKIGRVSIGNNVFVGAGSIVLPNVRIDDNTIIGAGSVVTKSLLKGGVYIGSPAKKIYEYDEWLAKEAKLIKESIIYGHEYKIGKINIKQKEKMKKELENSIGYIV